MALSYRPATNTLSMLVSRYFLALIGHKLFSLMIGKYVYNNVLMNPILP
jgi:hypothetical protein